jgi:hypothetical protein
VGAFSHVLIFQILHFERKVATHGVAAYPVRDFVGVVLSVEESAGSVRKTDLDLDHLLAFNPASTGGRSATCGPPDHPVGVCGTGRVGNAVTL